MAQSNRKKGHLAHCVLEQRGLRRPDANAAHGKDHLWLAAQGKHARMATPQPRREQGLDVGT